MAYQILLPMLQVGASFTNIFASFGWLALAMVALTIAVIISGLAYMGSEIFGSSALKSWAKSELYEALVSGAIIGVIASLLFLFATVGTAITGVPDIFTPGELFLNTMTATVSSIYFSLIEYEVIIGFLSTAGISIYLPELILTLITLSIVPIAGLAPVSDALIVIIDGVGVALGAFITQTVVLEFFKETMLTFFLPAGIALRALPISRRLGSSLIALAIACYFVYPLSLVLNQAVFENAAPINFKSYQNIVDICAENKGGFQSYVTGLNTDTNNAASDFFNNPIGPEESHWYSWFTSPVKWVWGMMTNGGQILKTIGTYTSKFLFLLVDPRKVTTVLYLSVIDQITPAMQFMIFAIMMPVVNIIITVTAYRSIASSIGGEEELFGLSKIV